MSDLILDYPVGQLSPPPLNMFASTGIVSSFLIDTEPDSDSTVSAASPDIHFDPGAHLSDGVVYSPNPFTELHVQDLETPYHHTPSSLRPTPRSHDDTGEQINGITSSYSITDTLLLSFPLHRPKYQDEIDDEPLNIELGQSLLHPSGEERNAESPVFHVTGESAILNSSKLNSPELSDSLDSSFNKKDHKDHPHFTPGSFNSPLRRSHMFEASLITEQEADIPEPIEQLHLSDDEYQVQAAIKSTIQEGKHPSTPDMTSKLLGTGTSPAVTPSRLSPAAALSSFSYKPTTISFTSFPPKDNHLTSHTTPAPAVADPPKSEPPKPVTLSLPHALPLLLTKPVEPIPIAPFVVKTEQSTVASQVVTSSATDPVTLTLVRKTAPILTTTTSHNLGFHPLTSDDKAGPAEPGKKERPPLVMVSNHLSFEIPASANKASNVGNLTSISLPNIAPSVQYVPRLQTAKVQPTSQNDNAVVFPYQPPTMPILPPLLPNPAPMSASAANLLPHQFYQFRLKKEAQDKKDDGEEKKEENQLGEGLRSDGLAEEIEQFQPETDEERKERLTEKNLSLPLMTAPTAAPKSRLDQPNVGAPLTLTVQRQVDSSIMSSADANTHLPLRPITLEPQIEDPKGTIGVNAQQPVVLYESARVDLKPKKLDPLFARPPEHILPKREETQPAMKNILSSTEKPIDTTLPLNPPPKAPIELTARVIPKRVKNSDPRRSEQTHTPLFNQPEHSHSPQSVMNVPKQTKEPLIVNKPIADKSPSAAALARRHQKAKKEDKHPGIEILTPEEVYSLMQMIRKTDPQARPDPRPSERADVREDEQKHGDPNTHRKTKHEDNDSSSSSFEVIDYTKTSQVVKSGGPPLLPLPEPIQLELPERPPFPTQAQKKSRKGKKMEKEIGEEEPKTSMEMTVAEFMLGMAKGKRRGRKRGRRNDEDGDERGDESEEHDGSERGADSSGREDSFRRMEEKLKNGTIHDNDDESDSSSSSLLPGMGVGRRRGGGVVEDGNEEENEEREQRVGVSRKKMEAILREIPKKYRWLVVNKPAHLLVRYKSLILSLPNDRVFRGRFLSSLSVFRKTGWIECDGFPDNVFCDLRRIKSSQTQMCLPGAVVEFQIELNDRPQSFFSAVFPNICRSPDSSEEQVQQ
ncbi:hypothetical protein BLNAU_5272 [Blattamonas nauphoetae]|uniref:Uncharacterized protein n=1 Tax=Blattamonas nauphoetae TaxID=2049346 RepID=A0ABQ9Y7W5_9EUKA|nr:hypothetical protein BLNAU_5272 [Blattamonas nauphoetae]